MSATPEETEPLEDVMQTYSRELSDLLTDRAATEGDANKTNEVQVTNGSVNPESVNLNSTLNVPHISVVDWVGSDVGAAYTQTVLDEDSSHSPSTADETVSYRETPSMGSVADSLDSRVSQSVRAAHRSYLSPLRSKRIDGLRSSLSPSGSPQRPSYLSNRSRASSATSMLNLAEMADDHTQAKPKETIKWTKLRKISEQLYSEAGRKAFGRPTCFVVSGLLAVGTSKGLILIFDYQQACKHIIGSGTGALAAGPVTAIALSADHTFVACGHEDGSIFSWELWKSSSAAKQIPPIKPNELFSKSGHVLGSRITHISFVGARHSCFVTSDSRGMTFYHNCTRRMLVSNVDTIRIIGRHPSSPDKPALKPSTTFASVVLPFGSVPHFTDSMGLVAVLTPYKLVIVSTSPVPRTQFKLDRPVGAVAEATDISGCACWFPSVKIDHTNQKSAPQCTKPMLAFSWCRQLRILSIEPNEDEKPDDPVANSITRTVVSVVKNFQCSETIVMIQWYSADILCILTKSNKMLLLDTTNMHLVGQYDLLSKLLVHHNIYTDQLMNYFNLHESEYVNQGFADSYMMSFQTYKGKTFMLGVHDVSVGTLLTWADRLLAFLTRGHYVEAVQLLTDYYQGTVELRGLNLPVSADQRKAKLRPKLYDTMTSSVKISLHSEELSIRSDTYQSSLLSACWDACFSLKDTKFCLNELFEVYEEAGRTEPYLALLATNILNNNVTSVPPSIVQQMVQFFTVQGLHTRLEDIVCHLEPDSLDINQILLLCKEHSLYNAFTYVTTEALHDFVAPMAEFIQPIKAVLRATNLGVRTGTTRQPIEDVRELGTNTVNAVKVFSYISLTLRGKVFPSCRERSSEAADRGKSLMYDFVFSGCNISWPPGSGTWLMTEIETPEPTFPYLRLLLLFDGPTFFACMDDAFEDPFLNDSSVSRSTPDVISRQSITRQFIINILFEVSTHGLPDEDNIYLYMFIARNVPKYPQFILLSGSVLQRILIGLCHYTDPELAEDCQLSVEYILSIFRPSDPSQMKEHYREARFYRVLKGIYRDDRAWVELLLAHLRDEGHESEVFDCIKEALGPETGLDTKQQQEVQDIILEHIVEIASLDGVRTAQVLDQFAPILHKRVFNALVTREGLLYIYLREIVQIGSSFSSWADNTIREKFIELLCIYERNNVMAFIKDLKLHEIDADKVIMVLENYGLIDSIVFLMSSEGKRSAALSRVVEKIDELRAQMAHPADHLSRETLNARMDTIEKFAQIGAGLCESESLRECAFKPLFDSENGHESRSESSHRMWTDLLSLVFSFLTTPASSIEQNSSSPEAVVSQANGYRIYLKRMRTMVQTVFSRLLITATRSKTLSFSAILRSVLDRITKTHSVAPVRIVIAEIFDSHQYHFQLLDLADRILALELFTRVETRSRAYRQGWRIQNTVCVLCREPLHNNSTLGMIFRERQATLLKNKKETQDLKRITLEKRHGLPIPRAAGKRKDHAYLEAQHETDSKAESLESDRLRGTTIISYACGHLVHETCCKARRLNHSGDSVQCHFCTSDSEGLEVDEM